MTNQKTNEELKEMSIYVYREGNGSVPKGWDFVRVDSNKKTGYYAETYKKGKEIAIAYRGSDINWEKGIFEAGKDISNDTRMLGMLKPEQLADAKNTYNEVKKSLSKFKNCPHRTFSGRQFEPDGFSRNRRKSSYIQCFRNRKNSLTKRFFKGRTTVIEYHKLRKPRFY